MCGRYNFTVEQSDEIIEILEKLNAKFHNTAVKNGDIYPTNQAPILTLESEEISPVVSTWGFPKFDEKGVIINARSESAFEKKTFRDSLLNRRCIIPSTGFYEWDSNKRKFLFRMEGTKVLYMAGLYSYYRDEMRFVILTTQSNESMSEIHDRMPLVIPKQEVSAWIKDSQATNDFIKRVPPLLVREEIKEENFGHQYKMEF